MAYGAWQAPLTTTEKNAAESIALSYQSNDPTLAGRDDTTQAHPLGTQVLLTEPVEQKHASTLNHSFVEVFLFNHQTHTAERRLVDLSTHTLVHSAPIKGVHLPLSDEEIDYSVSIVRDHLGVQERLRSELISLGRHYHADALSGLQLRVSIWVPHSQEHAKDSRCITERCTLVSIFDAEGMSYHVEPIVNLRTSDVFLDLIR